MSNKLVQLEKDRQVFIQHIQQQLGIQGTQVKVNITITDYSIEGELSVAASELLWPFRFYREPFVQSPDGGITLELREGEEENG